VLTRCIESNPPKNERDGYLREIKSKEEMVLSFFLLLTVYADESRSRHAISEMS